MRAHLTVLGLLCAALTSLSSSCLAGAKAAPTTSQRTAVQPAPAPARTAPPAAPPPGASAPVIGLPQALILVRSNLAALQAADQTGDYRVLYEMGAHDFQTANPPEKLASIFAHLRSYNLNAVLIDTPVFYQAPFVDPAGRLNIKGYFLKDGYRLEFLLMFQAEQGTWKLFGIGADVSATPPAKAP
jgi:hypothetical protein